jgi:hypothetical protein
MLSGIDGLPKEYEETIEDTYQFKIKGININIIDTSGDNEYSNATITNNINNINGKFLLSKLYRSNICL